MRIACLQFAPQVGDVDNNLNRADAVLSRANPEDLDLLVLPELAFTGYNFKSLLDISPYLEPSGSGISSLWARTTALRHNCLVAVGYPEKVDVAQKWPTSPEYYNSLIMVNGEGETIANYRKSFLYYTDETWALEGPDGFFEGHIPGLGDCAMGICMDINPYKFEAPWHTFEFAFHVLEVEANLVILSMAWLTREDSRMFTRTPKEPDMETVTYWITRLEPLIRADTEDEIIVVFCNRTGIEDDALYAGTSSVIGIKNGEVNVYGMLGRGEKELLVVDTDNAPYAKLIYRPDGESAESSQVGRPGESTQSAPTPQEPVRKPASPKPQHTSEQSSDNTGSQSRQSAAKDVQKPRPVLDTSGQQAVTSPPRKSKPQSPKIQIPYSPSLAEVAAKLKEDAAMAPAHTNIAEIPTPTGPSPVPEAHRPQLTQDRKPSRSRQPKKSSYTHVATPHPNAIKSDENRMFSGHVLISHEQFTPITPFDEPTPASPRYFWMPPDTLLKSPVGIRDQTPPTSRSSAARSKTPNTTQRPQSRPQISGSAEVPRTGNQNLREDAAYETEKPRTTSVSIERAAAVTGEPHPVRPASPKSRNASRTGRLERSDSSLAQRPDIAALSQKLDAISFGSTGGRTEENKYETTEQRPERPSSPKSRNASRSRPWLPADELIAEQQQGTLSRSFGVAAASSPRPQNKDSSVDVEDANTASTPGQHARSQSITSLSDHPNSRIGTLRHIAPLGSRYENRPQSRNAARAQETRIPASLEDSASSRNVSRGRQPGQNVPVVGAKGLDPPERSQSRRGWHNDNSIPRGRSREQHLATETHTQDIFATEVIRVSPSCPVHGAHSHSHSHSHNSPSPHIHQDDIIETEVIRTSPHCPVHGQKHTHSSHSDGHGSDRQSPASSGSSTSGQSASLGSGRKDRVPSAYSSPVGTISTPKYSPNSISFDPRTPKAMILVSDDIQSESDPGNTKTLKPLTFLEKDGFEERSGRPKSAVW